MSSAERERAAGRTPRQARGHERREGIIDAASEIVAAQGPEALTLHMAARRAGASIGSMYHFFQNRDELLQALAERHRSSLDQISMEARRIPAETWRAMTAEEVIERMFGRPLAYFSRHRDALALSSLHESAAATDFQSLLLQVLIARLGEGLGRKTADTLFAVSTGTLFFLRDTHLGGDEGPSEEIVKVLAAYLRDVERSAAGGA